MAPKPLQTTAEIYLPNVQTCLPALTEMTVDSFAGGGGASTGIEMAMRAIEASGVKLDSTDVTVAINHNGAALAMHTANHPGTIHMEADIWTVDPLATTGGRPVGLFWASPDCRHFSKAKGGAPVSDSVRGLAWVIAHWAEQVLPRLIFLENVEEFQDWGPTIRGAKGHLVADPKRKGKTFEKWISTFRKLGYRVEWKQLRACDYGAPTIRKRLYVIMRRDGLPIVWPAPTHGNPKTPAVQAGKLKPWRTAAEIIDWDKPCHSILMDRQEAKQYKVDTGVTVVRPLAHNTMARIAAGVKRYVLGAEKPFIVTCNHSGDGFRGQGLDEPFKTVAGSRDAHGLVQPFVVSYYGPRTGELADRSNSMDEPLRTVTTAARHGLVVPHIMTMRNSGKPYTAADEPTHTVTAGGAGPSLMSVLFSKLGRFPSMTSFYGQNAGGTIGEPAPTVMTKDKHGVVEAIGAMPPMSNDQIDRARQVAAFLREHDAWDEREFVVIGDYVIVDIGMRMLTCRELARAQGFPDDYILAAPFKDGVLSESDQRHKIGNSVCPPVAAALVGANYVPETRQTQPSDQGWLFADAA